MPRVNRTRPEIDAERRALAVAWAYAVASGRYKSDTEAMRALSPGSPAPAQLVLKCRKQPGIEKLLLRLRLQAANATHLDAARVRREILSDIESAREAGDYSTSLKGWQFLGKDLGMCPEKVTLTVEHVRALADEDYRRGLAEALVVAEAHEAAQRARALPAHVEPTEPEQVQYAPPAGQEAT